MNPIGPVSDAARPRDTARRTIIRLLLIQSFAAIAILLGVLVLMAGVDSRWLILLGLVLAGLVCAGLAHWISGKLLDPVERLVSRAEELASGQKTGLSTAEPVAAWMNFGETARLSAALESIASRLGAGAATPISTAVQAPAAPVAPPSGPASAPAVPAQAGVASQGLETLLRHLPWALWITDREGRILHHNALATALFETDSTDLRGQNIDPWLKKWAGETAGSEWSQAVKASQRWHGELEVVTRDHRTVKLEITAVPLEPKSASGATVFLAQDVSEIRQLGHLLIDLERHSTRGQMAGEVAHEINNFLTILGGNLDIIPMLLATGKQDKVQAKFASMRGVLEKIARFSDGLMGQRADAEPGPLDLNRQIENLVAFLKPQNRFDGVDLSYAPNPELPRVAARAGQIQQVLINLLNNAADAIHQGGRREGRIDVTVRRLSGRPDLALTVKDNGPGLSKAATARIFRERFSDKKSGYGLGLLNCHAIARELGGALTVESAEGQGTAFTLTLPVAAAKSAQDPTPALATS